MNSKVKDRIDKETNIQIKSNPIHETLTFGVILAIAGGFLDAYTYVGRDGVFANAQTGNIVLLGVYASLGQWEKAVLHIPPILSFIVGVFVAEGIKARSALKNSMDWKRGILLLEIGALFVVGFIPNSVPSIFVNSIISFVASLQVQSFRKLADLPYATTMCTGNLRSASQAAYNAIIKKDSSSAAISLRYFAVIFAFVAGSLLGGLCTFKMGERAVWGAALMLVLSVAFLRFREE